VPPYGGNSFFESPSWSSTSARGSSLRSGIAARPRSHTSSRCLGTRKRVASLSSPSNFAARCNSACFVARLTQALLGYRRGAVRGVRLVEELGELYAHEHGSGAEGTTGVTWMRPEGNSTVAGSIHTQHPLESRTKCLRKASIGYACPFSRCCRIGLASMRLLKPRTMAPMGHMARRPRINHSSERRRSLKPL
jgi:hypothetical protein